MEYVYILSANFTQRRRSVGGRHKPFPLDDEAHPSRTSSVCDWRCTKTEKNTEALYCSTGPQNYPLPRDPDVGTTLWLWVDRQDKILTQQNSSTTIKRFNAFCFVFHFYTNRVHFKLVSFYKLYRMHHRGEVKNILTQPHLKSPVLK